MSDKYNATFEEILMYIEINNVIDPIKTVFVLLKKYDEFQPENFIKCINEYIFELKSEEYENVQKGRTWDQFFSTQELLSDMMIFYMDLEPHEWTRIMDKYTDYSTSEVNEYIFNHVERFGLDINDWKFYSSALKDL